MQIRPVRMHFGYDAEFGAYTLEAYERLLLDTLAGDATLFLRRDEVEAAWRFADQIRAGCAGEAAHGRGVLRSGDVGPQGGG